MDTSETGFCHGDMALDERVKVKLRKGIWC
jgi:hypothetical protein